MEPIVILCKSHAKDLLRAKRLAQSLATFNRDAIPVYVCMPKPQMALFEEHLDGFDVRLITDEQVLARAEEAIGDQGRTLAKIPAHLVQQVVKAEFWRLGLGANTLVVDSDSYFIRPFCRSDLLWREDIPFTVMHEGKELLQFAARSGLAKVVRDYRELRRHFQQLFGLTGPLWDFGPTPVIWSSKVWESLARDYAAPRQTHTVALICEHPCEMLWYGNHLVASGVVPLVPIEPLFKCYHYRQQFEEAGRLGETEAVVARNFFGVVIQSNWDPSLDWPAETGGRSWWRRWKRADAGTR